MHPIALRAIETDDPLDELVRAVYAPDGPIAAAGFQIRPQQVEISVDIATAMMRDRGWTLHQAPTGVGKSFSYLLPGVLEALRAEAKIKASEDPSRPFRRVLVSTANIALQDQIVSKDVPMIARLFGVEVRASIQKSVSNYICRKSVDNFDGIDPDVKRLVDWSKWSNGDREGIEWDAGPAWGRVSRSSDDCLGPSCEHYRLGSETPCFWRLAQRATVGAHVIVTNHAMLARIKPMDVCLLAIDEAHVLESALRGSGEFRLRQSPGRGVATIAAEFVEPDVAINEIEDPAAVIYREAVGVAFGGRQPRDGDSVRLRPGWVPEDRAQRVQTCLGSLERAQSRVERAATQNEATAGPYGWRGAAGNEVSGKAARAANAITRLNERLRLLVSGGAAGDDGVEHVVVVGASTSNRGSSFVDIDVSPIEVTRQFERLVRGYPRAALTSATLHDDRAFDASLGISVDDPFLVRKRLPSPFDLPNQGLLVVPTGPPPTDHGWDAWAREMVVQAVQGAKGRTLVLSSTWRQAQSYAEALREASTEYPILVQGEQGRAVLRQRFRDEVDSVLVATRSFFEGLDVQGESCSCVIIDRIPFARPDDLVEDAVATAIARRAGGSAFHLRTVPEAAMVLAQGAGRLIRSATDRGVLVMLDGRILQSGSSWRRLASALPPFRRSGTVRDVGAFLEGRALAGVVEPPKRHRMVLSDWED